tara:strand:+ start:438 stop:782 length:345 start_codon:yes stop_codon:yes gene_type:complete
MIEVPSSDYPEEDRVEMYATYLLEDLLKSISIYIVRESLTNSFYNFSDFFLKQRVGEDKVKDVLKNKVIKELQSKGYKLAYAFNKTGLIITKSEEDLMKSTWKANLDWMVIKDD